MNMKLCILIYSMAVYFVVSGSLLQTVLYHCTSEYDIGKCLKMRVLKSVERALNSKKLSVIDGITLIRNDRQSRCESDGLKNETELQKLDSEELNQLLRGAFSRFINSHHLEVSVPRLLEVGRKKDKDQGSNGALYWALAIKGSFLAMAYQGIAVMSGLALVMGKMALLLSAILGLKKLVSSNSQEATTLEIVKQPKYTEQHSYSDSYDDEVHHKP